MKNCFKKIVAIIMTLSLMLFTLVNCVGCDNKNEVNYSDTLIVGTTQTITSLNRLESSSGKAGYNFDVLSGTVSQMSIISNNTVGEFIPALCNYSSSQDCVSWTFTIEKDYYWHDDTLVTADDIKYTLEQNLKEDIYSSITKSENNKSVTVTLLNANPRFLNSIVVIRVLPKHIFEGKTAETLTDAESVIGAGPFKFVKFDKEAGTIEFSKFEKYPKAEKISFNKVIFKIFGSEDIMHLALTTNDIDTEWIYSKSIGASYESLLSKDETITLENYSALKNPMCLYFNNQVVTNLNVRKAVSKAIDYSKIRRLFGTTMTTPSTIGFVPKACYGSIETEELSCDLTSAKTLLTEAGYSNENKLSLTILVRSDNVQSEVAKVLKTDLEATGMISVTIDSKEVTLYQTEVKAKTFQMVLASITAFGMNNEGGLGSMYMTSSSTWPYANMLMTDEANNDTEYAIIHNALSSAKTETEYKEAAKNYQEYFKNNIPAISLYNDSVIMAHSSKVTGFSADGTFGFLSISQFETLKKVL